MAPRIFVCNSIGSEFANWFVGVFLTICGSANFTFSNSMESLEFNTCPNSRLLTSLYNVVRIKICQQIFIVLFILMMVGFTSKLNQVLSYIIWLTNNPRMNPKTAKCNYRRRQNTHRPVERPLAKSLCFCTIEIH